MSEELYMVRLELSWRSVLSLAKRRQIPVRELDEGQAVHCALGELFRDNAPKPFLLSSRRTPSRRSGALQVHAYSSATKVELLQSCDAFGDLDLHEAFDRDSIKQRRMPECFPERMGFSVRLCPIVRLSGGVSVEADIFGKTKKLERPAKKNKRGCEVDAFEAARLRSHEAGTGEIDSSRRSEIYLDWFRGLVERTAGLEILAARLTSQRVMRLWRRDHGTPRKSHPIRRPEVTVSGELRVNDQDAFRGLLRRGIGRHKAFGFGMIMLRPASEV